MRRHASGRRRLAFHVGPGQHRVEGDADLRGGWQTREGDVMNIVLWVLQVLLAAVFLAHGWLFLSPPPDVAEQMNALLARWFQLFLGVAEVLAAVGLILPGLTRIMSWLVAWAAGGVMIVTVSATVLHLVRGEMSSAAITLLLFAMATVVAYMRHRVLPIGIRRATEGARQARADRV
jgi:uncharacterized membrane protein YphA (DoxX/SURF4 family)